MKKILLVLVLVIICSCQPGTTKRLPLNSGDIRITISDKQVIYEKLSGFDSFGTPNWILDKIESREEFDTKYPGLSKPGIDEKI